MNEQRWVDKSDWGDGPWQSEPDRIEWRAHGFPCLMLRSPHGGMWCGYVGVPPGHPWHGARYDDLDVGVHGGLTFGQPCMNDERPLHERVCHVPEPGEPDDVWWLGFHAWWQSDIAPAYEARMREHHIETVFEHFRHDDPHYAYRDVEYVRAEVESLAAQCARPMNEGSRHT